jgi:Flp pilus assembly protein TadG
MATGLHTRERHGEQGQVLPLFAGGLLVLLVLVGLVIDTGVAFKERRAAQNISDLAAMAGTRVIAEGYLNPSVPVTGAGVYAVVDKSITVNGCTTPCTWTGAYVRPTGSGTFTQMGPIVNSGDVPVGAQGVTVTTSRQPGTYFIRLIGQDKWDVSAVATAMSSRLPDPPPGILLPIGIFDAPYETGREYTLTLGVQGPGNFGWLSWTGPVNTPTLETSLCTPDSPAFAFPAWFDGTTGTKNSSTIRACMQGYIDNQTVVYIPIWKQTNGRGGSNLQYEITGLAAFVLTDFPNHAIDVTGHFVEFYSYPSVPAGFGAPPCSATVDPNCDERFNFIGLVQ